MSLITQGVTNRLPFSLCLGVLQSPGIFNVGILKFLDYLFCPFQIMFGTVWPGILSQRNCMAKACKRVRSSDHRPASGARPGGPTNPCAHHLTADPCNLPCWEVGGLPCDHFGNCGVKSTWGEPMGSQVGSLVPQSCCFKLSAVLVCLPSKLNKVRSEFNCKELSSRRNT